MSKNVDTDVQMRKRNMKLFPIYKKLAWDYLFYYSIDFLFLTQIKNISAANVVLANSIKYLFGIFIQIPANIIVEFLGRRNSIILGNILNCFYILMFMMTGNLFDLILAKFISSLAVSIKDIAEPGLLNASIPPSKYKSNIFAKINARGASGFYILSAISKIIGGFLFEINGYIPMILCLITLIFVSIVSMLYIEPIKKSSSKSNASMQIKKQMKDIQEGFQFILKSERLKALILSASLIASFLSIMASYRTSLLQDIGTPAYIISFAAAAFSASSAIGAKRQKEFNDRFKNKSIIVVALMTSISAIIAGILGLKKEQSHVLTIIIVLLFLIAKFAHGVFHTIMDRYFRNFTNKEIDTKIFAVKNLFVNIVSATMGIMASFLLNKMSTAYCMLVLGTIFTIMYLLMSKYMKARVGLKPEEYSKFERKYDELQ
ncbi:MAG: MFS transporter [Clostridia bacterium]|nr:MFS transporter [Clostridia bacterium]